MVIESDPSFCKLLVDDLEGQGFAAASEANGETGLQLALSDHPDLVLLDIQVPGISGMEVLKRLRQDDWGKNVPVILLTDLSATEENVIKGIAEYAPRHYLVKSDWKISEVVEKINEALET